MTHSQKKYWFRKNSGLCTACGLNQPRLKFTTCEGCGAKAANRGRTTRKTKKDNGICIWSGCDTISHKSGKFCINHINESRINHKSSIKTLKTETFNAYGGVLCSCCGETRINALCIDHIFNDGAKQRLTIGRSGHHLYTYLRKLGFPDKDRFQVLCANCNIYKQLRGSPCYHRVNSASAAV